MPCRMSGAELIRPSPKRFLWHPPLSIKAQRVKKAK
jgi:hypothetical protein